MVAGDRAVVSPDQREELLLTWFRDVLQMPAAELALLRSAPSWRGRIAAAHTLLREIDAAERYGLEPGRFGARALPTLLLLGEQSPPYFADAVDLVHRAVPGSRVVVLPGQKHVAMNSAVTLFLDAVVGFFESGSPQP